MLGFIKRRREKREFDRSRELFTFFDGKRMRSIDPWRCYRAFLSHPQSEEAMHPGAMEGEEPFCTAAIEATCDAFGLRRFDPETNEGMTDSQILDFIVDITAYMEEVKKKHESGLTLPSATESKSCDWPEPTPTKRPSDSGSTLSEPACEGQA